MSVADNRLVEFIDAYIDKLESPHENIRRRATDELYESIVAHYADVSSSLISSG